MKLRSVRLGKKETHIKIQINGKKCKICHKDKSKGIEIDQEGFQKVHYKGTGARCNIFGISDVLKPIRKEELRNIVII